MKKIIATIIAITLLFNFAYSQDVIKLKTGLEIKAKIIEVGVKEVKYKKFDFLEGPNYVISKKQIKLIKYENNKIDVFAKQKEESKTLYTRKINHFRKQKNIGLLGAGAGVLGATILYVNYKKWDKTVTETNRYEQGGNYFLGAYFTTGVAIAGVVLAITGNKKVNEYSKKLRNLSVGVNLSQKQKGISLVYRF